MEVNNILATALLAKVKTTLKLLETHPNLNTKDFWKNKFERKYPNSYLVKNWSYKENCLAREKGEFDTIVTADDGGVYKFWPNIFTHSEITKIVLDNIYSKYDHYMVKTFKLDKRFVLIKINHDDTHSFDNLTDLEDFQIDELTLEFKRLVKQYPEYVNDYQLDNIDDFIEFGCQHDFYYHILDLEETKAIF